MTIGEIRKVNKFLERYDFCEVTETTTQQLNNTYEVECLEVWNADGIAGFIDINNKVLKTKNSLLNGFIMGSVGVVTVNDSIKLTFKNGTVNIVGLC